MGAASFCVPARLARLLAKLATGRCAYGFETELYISCVDSDNVGGVIVNVKRCR